jgi:ankyrin repeat protein
MASADDSNDEHRIGYENRASSCFGYDAYGTVAASSNLGESFAMLNTGETTNAPAFHTSWSNSSAEDFLGLASRAHESAHLAVERPDSIARAKSTPSSRNVSIGEHDGVSSIIHDAARITNWRTVKALCETNPEAAKYAGRDGLTALLHHACNRRCPDADVVEALIRAYPDALLEEEEKGWTPLHYACRYKTATDVVRLLLHLYPEKGHVAVSRSDRQG